MLSIIVCSVNRKYLLNFEKNVAETIGDNVEYEILAIDNKVMRLSICAAYNRAASEARYPYLLFIHEDVEFLEKGWWAKVMPQLSKPDCGVIGFAGTVAMVDSPAGWGQSRKWSVLNFTQLTKGRRRLYRQGFENSTYRQVVALDGFAMFVRRSVWQETPFDEQMLKGFHCYDVDFSLSVNQRYKNYVCGVVDIFHYSPGNFNEAWFREVLKTYKKWHDRLPVWVDDPEHPISRQDMKRIHEKLDFKAMKKVKKLRDVRRWPYVKRFFRHGMSLKHLEHIIRAFV